MASHRRGTPSPGFYAQTPEGNQHGQGYVMIERWRLSNFKSVYEQVELPLAPLTVFAGANSSGKSTFIQSILLVAQTLTSQVHSRPVVLNGHIIRLGKF